MIACGINPDDFGTYDQRAKAQAAARADFQQRRCEQLGGPEKSHPPPCHYKGPGGTCTCYQTQQALDSEGSQNWIYLNSQSGHLSQNCFYQAPGARADPCSNIRPSSSADGTQNSGGYGYRDNDALCMDHIGLRTGQEHYWVCRGEQAHRQSLGPNAPVPESELQRGVENSARVVVDRSASSQGGAPNVDDNLTLKAGGKTETRAARGDLVNQARGGIAQSPSGSGGAQGAAGAGATQGQGSPNSPAGGGASDADKNKAVECIKDAWKKSLHEMQTTAVAEHSTAGQLSRDEVAAYNAAHPNAPVGAISQMPEPHRAAAQGRVDAGVQARQRQLEQQGAERAGATGDPHPTADECLEYQGNWLYQNQRPDGTFPPMQGSTGSGPPPNTGPETVGNGEDDEG